VKPGTKGYTLIELLIAITIMVLVSGAASVGIFQIIRNTERNGNHMSAVLQVQNAGNRISYDAQTAQSVTTDNLTPPSFVVLLWVDGSTGHEYQITYTLEDMPDSPFKELRRNQSVNGSANITSLVAQYIDADSEKTTCELSNGILTLTVTATVGGGSTMESETKTYQVVLRPG
jgi:prepilin-type N-terminal cleavage/methylation domain-containing protein